MHGHKRSVRTVFAVSDATGKTCETVIHAALTQFKTTDITLEVVANVRTSDQISDLFTRAAQVNGVVIYTMVSPTFRQRITELGRRHGVPTVDILGPVMTRLSDLLEKSPLAKPGLFHHLDDEYLRRLDAVDYTIKHDDGLMLATVDQAEIVIVGVSRTSKTPVSIYLSYRGWRVANVPVVLDHPLPEELGRVDPRRVIALSVTPERLEMLRRERLARMEMSEPLNYVDADQVRREVGYGLRLYREREWPVVDVTYKSIEETATEIMRIIYGQLGDKKGNIKGD